MIYLWIKAFHIIFMVAWFAGMFYIWRLFVYHMENPHQEVKNQLAIMERRLYKIIMMPAMILTVTFGIIMLIMNWNYFLNVGWIWVKILVVFVLLYWHFLVPYYMKQFEKGVAYPSKKFRIMNEVPTLILIITVLLAILKPF
ncbi:MAG: protoporphyrinogen oxidase HemJ [Leptospiraceae bacterium]|nr:protoporphyrinogen oxidase HemJ [Leptospiraceae bacterium]MDW7976081.1 protoporphyrinogen oxidase HemJ [Leptospiraceae bacterium]